MNNIPKGYKPTEVGVIPGDWEIKRLGDAAEVVMGQSPIGTSYNRCCIGAPLINGPTEFTEKHPIKIQWTSQPTKFCKKGDVLLCVRGSSTGRLNISDDEYCIGRGIAAIRAKSWADTSFITFQVESAVKSILALTTGSTFPNIDGKSIKAIEFPCPHTKAEQTAIAAALSDADALITSLEKLIAKKRNIKQGAMQQLLKPKDNWAMKKLGDILTFSGGYSASREQLSNEGFCYLHYGDIHGAKKTFINVKNEYTEIPKLKISLKNVSPKSLLNDGDIVFVDASEDDEGTSRHLIVKNPDGIPYISGLHTIVAKSTDDLLDNDFKRYCFQTKLVKSQFTFYAVGTKVSGISKTTIAKIEIAIPPKSEQTRIAAILSDMDAEIEVLEQKLNKYRQIKQGMMQELLTGKTRLV